MTADSTTNATSSPTMSPTPCKYITSIFNSTFELDDCAKGVFAGVGTLVVIAIALMCLGICCCCCKQHRKRRSEQRTKPLVATQAASWFTSSLTSKLTYQGVVLAIIELLATALLIIYILESFNKQSSNKQVSSKQNDYPKLPTR